jgi:hypothetical protein
MRRGVNLSQHELRILSRRIRAREKVLLQNVRDEAVLGLIQILRAMGAEIDVNGVRESESFKKWPKR